MADRTADVSWDDGAEAQGRGGEGHVLQACGRQESEGERNVSG